MPIEGGTTCQSSDHVAVHLGLDETDWVRHEKEYYKMRAFCVCVHIKNF